MTCLWTRRQGGKFSSLLWLLVRRHSAPLPADQESAVAIPSAPCLMLTGIDFTVGPTIYRYASPSNDFCNRN